MFCPWSIIKYSMEIIYKVNKELEESPTTQLIEHITIDLLKENNVK